MLKVLSGGAARGLVTALTPRIEAETGMGIDGDYGPVGVRRDRIAGGEALDVAILSRRLIEELVAHGQLLADSVTDVGEVATGVAVRAGDPAPDCTDAEALKAALLDADGIFCPDPQMATAGIHFRRVLEGMGLDERVADRLHAFPGGHPAMQALAASTLARPLGCTQVTEILGTEGVELAGELPAPHALVTTYTAAVSAGTAKEDAARAMIAVLAGAEAAGARRAAGFRA